MYTELDFAIRLINGVVTLAVGLYTISYISDKNLRNGFNMLWSLGFISWGLSIIIRTLTNDFTLILPLWLAVALSFIFGTGNLLGFGKVFHIIAISSFSTSILLYQYFPPNSPIGIINGLYFFMLMTLVSLMLRARIGPLANLLVIGWLLTFITNILFALNLRPAIVDGLGILAKSAFFLGITSSRFAYAAYLYDQKFGERHESVFLEERRKTLQDNAAENLHKTDKTMSERRFHRFRAAEQSRVFTERLFQSFLDLVIASRLASGVKMTGYEIVLYIHQKYGVLFSPGTVYPILHGMEQTGLIEGRTSGRRKPYVLTERGFRWYEDVTKEYPEMLKILEITRV